MTGSRVRTTKTNNKVQTVWNFPGLIQIYESFLNCLVAQKTEQNAHIETVTNDKTVKKTQFLRDYFKKIVNTRFVQLLKKIELINIHVNPNFKLKLQANFN